MGVGDLQTLLCEYGISPERQRPCSRCEVEAVEKFAGRRLPGVSRDFLLATGHGAGDLMRDADMFYPDLLRVKSKFVAAW